MYDKDHEMPYIGGQQRNKSQWRWFSTKVAGGSEGTNTEPENKLKIEVDRHTWDRRGRRSPRLLDNDITHRHNGQTGDEYTETFTTSIEALVGNWREQRGELYRPFLSAQPTPHSFRFWDPIICLISFSAKITVLFPRACRFWIAPYGGHPRRR